MNSEQFLELLHSPEGRRSVERLLGNARSPNEWVVDAIRRAIVLLFAGPAFLIVYLMTDFSGREIFLALGCLSIGVGVGYLIAAALTRDRARRADGKPESWLHGFRRVRSMVRERLAGPTAFHTLDEETLRTLFLVPLNGHYDGEATGETFNCEGKTDILIRHGGKNIFIAECKFWQGQKALTDTIDQVLRYTSWRDTIVRPWFVIAASPSMNRMFAESAKRGGTCRASSLLRIPGVVLAQSG